MPVIYSYPVAATLQGVDRDLLFVLTADDPLYGILPLANKDSPNVIWEQGLPARGLMQIRGYDAEFPSVPGLGVNRFVVPPGIYGEEAPITEQEITERRAPVSFNMPIDITDLVTERHGLLSTRHYNRMSQVGWALLALGQYSILGPTGAVLKRDGFTPQLYVAGTSWSNATAGAPLADLRAVSVLHRGHSVAFNASARVYMNLVTFNNLASNNNPNDLGDRRQTGLWKAVAGQAQLNEVLTQDNLPNIVVHDEGYTSDGTDGLTLGTFVPFIPDHVAVVVGRRTNGAMIGEWQMTRNASNPNVGPGPMVRVVDTGADENTRPPRRISVYRSMNGGPACYLPTSIVVMAV